MGMDAAHRGSLSATRTYEREVDEDSDDDDLSFDNPEAALYNPDADGVVLQLQGRRGVRGEGSSMGDDLMPVYVSIHRYGEPGEGRHIVDAGLTRRLGFAA